MAAPRAFSLSSRSAHESVSHLQCTRRNKPAASWSQQSKGTWNLEQLMNPDNEWVTSTQLRSRYGSIYHFCTVYSIRRRPSLLIPRPLLLNFFFFFSFTWDSLQDDGEGETVVSDLNPLALYPHSKFKSTRLQRLFLTIIYLFVHLGNEWFSGSVSARKPTCSLDLNSRLCTCIYHVIHKPGIDQPIVSVHFWARKSEEEEEEE